MQRIVSEHCDKGYELLEQENYEQAIVSFNLANNSSPSSHAYYGLGRCYFDLNKLSEALKQFDKSIELSSKDIRYEYMGYSARGFTHYKLNNFNAALNDFNKSIQSKPKENLAYHNLGLLYQALGDFDQAIENLKQAMELASNQDYSYLHLGMICYIQQNLTESVACFSKVEILNKKLNRFYINLQLACSGDTALHIAIRLQDERLVSLLLENGIDHSIQNKKGDIPIYEALVNDDVKILTLLLTKIDLHTVPLNRHGESVFEIAVKQGAHKCSAHLLYLLQKKILLDMKDNLPEKSFLSTFSSYKPRSYIEQIKSLLIDLNFTDADRVNEVYEEIRYLFRNGSTTSQPNELEFNNRFLEQVLKLNNPFGNTFQERNYYSTQLLQTNSIFPPDELVPVYEPYQRRCTLFKPSTESERKDNPPAYALRHFTF